MPRNRPASNPKPPSKKRVSRQPLPHYEADNGPLTEAQKDAIDRLQPPGRSKVAKRLF